jgi:hypothetical protein
MRSGPWQLRFAASGTSKQATDPERIALRNRWADLLITAKSGVSDLIDATESRYRNEMGLEPPSRILLYIDQSEELYSRNEKNTVRCFSKILGEALKDTRLTVLASQRADYYGFLQTNKELFSSTLRIDVAPLGLEALKEVIRGPAAKLGVRFESDALIEVLANAYSEAAGALPLLADLMTDLWRRAQERGIPDGRTPTTGSP